MRYLLSNPQEQLFAQIDLKQAIVTIRGGASGESLEVTLGEGNCSYTEKRNIQYTLDKGALDEVREGDEVPVDVKIDATWEYITSCAASGETPTIIDVLKRHGAASDWTSSDADTCRPYAVDIEIQYLPVCAGVAEGDKETITLEDFRYEDLAFDLKAGTFSISGKCNVTEATVVRASQS